MRLLSEIHERPLHDDGTGPSQQLFWALELAAADRHRQGDPLGVIHRRLRHAIAHRRIRFFFNPREEAVAYFVWADLAFDVHQRWMTGSLGELHESEWNEGVFRWAIEVVAPYGHSRRVVRRLLQDFAADPHALDIYMFTDSGSKGPRIKTISKQRNDALASKGRPGNEPRK